MLISRFVGVIAVVMVLVPVQLQTSEAETAVPETGVIEVSSSVESLLPVSPVLSDTLPAPTEAEEPASQKVAEKKTTVAPVKKTSAPASPSRTTRIAYTSGPSRVEIPSIGLNTRVIGVGVNGKGEMAVPDGSTDLVGWYKNGTIPGNVGSAVFDAHVFAAFKDLESVSAGDTIYVTATDGSKLRFVVDETHTYALPDLAPDMLFNRRDARRLTLITCAGSYVESIGTYDRRLVIYAKLAA